VWGTPVAREDDAERAVRAAFEIVDAVAALAEHQDGAVAAGALPFAGGGELLIGASIVRREDPFVTTRIGAAQPPTPVTGLVPSDAFAAAALSTEPDPAFYAGAVQEVARRIRAGELRKAVLARTITVAAGRALDPRRLAHRLRAVDPGAYTFIAPVGDGVLVGASPELLVARRGNQVMANPLAGSAPRSGDRAEDRAFAQALLASEKDREEHAVVVEAIVDTLGPFCERLEADPEPMLAETANVWHLSTRIRGHLVAPAPTAVDLALLLHPTPAVAGTPTAAALGVLGQFEPFERGAYAGPIGWVDANGDGTWAIALRCALLRDDAATLYAGAGIVGASDPDAELEETERKFRAFLDALRWG
jgi:isochorismate synthase